MNVFDLLSGAARRWPSQIALIGDDETQSYATAEAAARAVATALQAVGVRPGDRVGCLMQNNLEHYHAYFGIAAAGAILVSLNTRLSAAEQAAILQHAEATVLLHDANNTARAAELQQLRPLALLAGATAARATPLTALPLARTDDPAHLYYTSGTTGSPKGVVLSHGNVTTHAANAVTELALAQDDIWAHIAPMFHLADAWATFGITQAGGRHVFLERFSAAGALDLLEQQRVTITNLVPTMLNLMVNEPGAASRDYALRVMLSGGAPIAPDVVRRILGTFCCDYVQTYGMTETSPYLSLSIPPPELRQLPLEEQLRWKCKTGRAFAGVTLRVVHADGSDVAADGRTVGEVRVAGATVTKGYWRNPEATRAAFDERGFLRTGDLATIDEHGFLDIVDRLKDVIKTGAETVYSVEVEHVLMEHPAVLECAVFGRPDPLWGERVVAAVVLRPGAHADEAELIAAAKARIAHYKAPKQVLFLDALPRTGSGKIQKRALRELPDG